MDDNKTLFGRKLKDINVDDIPDVDDDQLSNVAAELIRGKIGLTDALTQAFWIGVLSSARKGE